MLKFLIILILIIYVLAKVGGYIFKLIYTGASEATRHTTSGQRRKAPDSDLDIDFIPKNGGKNSKGYDGGEYIDYEEVEK